MKVKLLLHTIAHLKPTQIVYQIKNRLIKPTYKDYVCNQTKEVAVIPFINKYKCLENNRFTFLNLTDTFSSWNDNTKGMLWAYNLNYMDWLLQENISKEESVKWIDKFIDDLPNNKVGLDPYPIALRGINWVKFFTLYPTYKTKDRINSLYSQYKLLEKKLEYHLLGNHLLEDAYSLFIGGGYFEDKKMLNKAKKLLRKELQRQILKDGSHYEQSPMYHCILLDRLLDCYNFAYNDNSFEDKTFVSFLKDKAEAMLGHLGTIIYNDYSIPLLNDASLNIAPTPKQIFEYAKQMNLSCERIPLRECGYRKFLNNIMEAIVDVGNITATYQPGHTHADTFNYELRINGKRFIVDTGISTYNKDNRRQYERSTPAHNTVSINNTNSSEVWGGFRLGRRAKVEIIQQTPYSITAKHNGFRVACERRFECSADAFMVEDKIEKEAVSYIHLDPKVKIISWNNSEIVTSFGKISVLNANKIEIEDTSVAQEYNKLQNNKTIKIYFYNFLKYSITHS